jgi:lipopolysaccharide biosynthesis glycosyltransferase
MGGGDELAREMKVYHFVGAKPWKKRDGSGMNRVWWGAGDEVSEWFRVDGRWGVGRLVSVKD